MKDGSIFPSALIESTLEAGFGTIRSAGLTPEHPSVGVAVEEHRWSWKPDNVRVLLIAESHVYTSPADMRLRVQRSALPAAARHAPAEFVRLIYCLGYGETRVLSGVPEGRNSGTPQFWNIFGRVAGTGRQPTTVNATTGERLEWKVSTLQVLQRKGVWLLDASLHGIYAPGAQRVSPALTSSLHALWLNTYGRWLLDQHPSSYKCAIGGGVAKTLGSLGLKLDNWIYQPQARNVPGVDLERGWKELLAATQISPQQS